MNDSFGDFKIKLYWDRLDKLSLLNKKDYTVKNLFRNIISVKNNASLRI